MQLKNTRELAGESIVKCIDTGAGLFLRLVGGDYAKFYIHGDMILIESKDIPDDELITYEVFTREEILEKQLSDLQHTHQRVQRVLDDVYSLLDPFKQSEIAEARRLIRSVS